MGRSGSGDVIDVGLMALTFVEMKRERSLMEKLGVTRGKWEMTLRNLRAMKKQVAALEKRVKALEKGAKRAAQKDVEGDRSECGGGWSPAGREEGRGPAYYG